jgi:gliding motility-associated protein GldN
MYREDDFGDGEVKYPLFWVRYDDLAPFLAKQTIMTSNLNNAATMSVDDYFTMNLYKGKIYKMTNMLGKTLAQYCPNDSAMAAEQKKIERELVAFERTIYGDPARRDSLDSISAAKEAEKVPKRGLRTRRSSGSSSSFSRSRRPSNSSSAVTSPARVTVRRERH